MFCCNLAKMGLKSNNFLKDHKRQNGQIILFLDNCFKKGKKAKWQPRQSPPFSELENSYRGKKILLSDFAKMKERPILLKVQHIFEVFKTSQFLSTFTGGGHQRVDRGGEGSQRFNA
jgi:hypothetical protein